MLAKYLLTSEYYSQLKKLNFKYGNGVSTCDIFKNAHHVEIKDNIIVLTLKKESSQSWYEYLLSLSNKNGEITMECKIAVTIIRNLYMKYDEDEMMIKLLTIEECEDKTNLLSASIYKLYEYKNGCVYLSHDLNNYVLCTYNDLHPGIWLYPDPCNLINDEPKYIGLSHEGIKIKPISYWEKFISHNELDSFVCLNDKPSHLGKFYKEGKIHIYTIPKSPSIEYMLMKDSVIIFINNESIELSYPNILEKILDYSNETNLNITSEDEHCLFSLITLNFETEIGKKYSPFCFSMIFNFSSLSDVYNLYPIIENM